MVLLNVLLGPEMAQLFWAQDVSLHTADPGDAGTQAARASGFFIHQPADMMR